MATNQFNLGSSNLSNSPTSQYVMTKEQFLAIRGAYTLEVETRQKLEATTSLRSYASQFLGGRTVGEAIQYHPAGEYTNLKGEKSTIPVFVIFPWFGDTSPSWGRNSWSVHALIDLFTDSYQEMVIGKHVRHFNPSAVFVPNAMMMRVDPDPKYGMRSWLNFDYKNGSFVPHGWAQDDDGRKKYAAFASKANTVDDLLKVFWAGQKLVVGVPQEIQDSKILRTLMGRLDLTIAELKAEEVKDAQASKDYRKAQRELPKWDGSPVVVGGFDLSSATTVVEVQTETPFGKSSRTIDPAKDNSSNLAAIFTNIAMGMKVTVKK